MRIFFFVSFLLLATVNFAQVDSVIVEINVSDKTDDEPIANVNATLTINGKSLFKRTSPRGKFTIKVANKQLINGSLNHTLFEGSKFAQRAISNEDTLKWYFSLIPLNRVLKEVVVKAPGVPDTVFGSRKLNVADFEVQENGDVLLLTYPKQLKKGSEMVLHNGYETISTFTIPGVAKELVSDFRHNTHVVCEDNVYAIYTNEKKIGIATIEKDYFFKYLAPIVDTNQTKMYFSNFNPDFPAFEYFSYDQLDSSYRKICNIKDYLMMELYRSEYKWVDIRTKLWAKRKEIETGVDKEIWVGANYFTQSLYYKELYAPLFHRNDTLFVFDYYKDLLFSYDKYGDVLDSIPIFHHYKPKKTGWKAELIQDKANGQIYALYDRAGYSFIGKIDTKTGEIGTLMKLSFRFVEKIQIQDNFVYYIYRPFESPQKKFLYKERSVF
ncbi:MAG: hypothetical protein V4638_05695 [Bacteroidota bacterium]